MKRIISERLAINSLLTVLSLVVIFHFLVVLNIIPFDIVWGGRLKDPSQMLVFEAVSVVLNLIMIAVVGMKAGFIKKGIHPMIIKVGLWMMCGLFLLNTIGNIFSNNELEKIIFTPLTAILFLFSYRLAISENKKVAE